MSFAAEVKNEITKRSIDSVCCARSELAGMVCFAAQIKGNSLKLITENEAVVERFNALLKYLYKLRADVIKSNSNVYRLNLEGDEAIKILRDMKLGSIPIRIDESIIRKDCCKQAFVAGAFLGGGSISDPDKGYHMEFVTHHFALCEGFNDLLLEFGISPKIINRKGNYVFYIKDSTYIEDMLVILGAHKMMMEFLNIKIEKELRNDTNRMVNCDSANVNKTVKASILQREAISKVKKTIGLDNLPYELSELARLREENPESSLSELATMLGITKSGVNHRMRRIIELSEE